MHWLAEAAVRAGLDGAATLSLPQGTTTTDAWEIGARTLGVTPSQLATQLAAHLRIKPANLQTVDPKATRLLPEKLGRRFNVFPIREDDRQLIVATSDPSNLDCEQAVAFAAGRRVVFELAPPHAITQAINAGYATEQRSVDSVLSVMDAELASAVSVLEELKPEMLGTREVETAPVVQLTNLILRDAVVQRASDVHIEPGEGGGIVRFRIDGVMRRHMPLPMAALNRVVSRIKVIGKLDIADRMRPQDGRTRIQVEGKTFDLRISTVPIRDSEKAVIRILRPDSTVSLEDADLAAPELARLRQLLGFRDGIVLVTGPTGSGKTTTLYAALRELATKDVNITTVEDPVEYELKGIAQIQVDTKRGMTFASALRAVLRQDPDVIFIGEIRDKETAEIAVQAAMTGHLVLATLHTNDAMSCVPRLIDLGLDKAAIAGSVRGSLAQRLVRKLCGECAVAIRPDENLTPEEQRLAGALGVRPLKRARGCTRCANSGYFGRMPVDEVAAFTPIVIEQILQGAPASALQRAAISGGMRTLRDAAIERVARGETTLTEVERVIGEQAAQDTAKLGPMILVVDDDPVQRLLIAASLEKNGYRVQQASDGVDALLQVEKSEELALVLTDLDMPAMNGDDVIRRLRSAPQTVALPIIVLTGSAAAARESELIELGADDYIRKPVEPALLLARVRAALRRAAS